MPEPIIITEYDPRWPAMFAAEKARIIGVLGYQAIAIEHIGSTAVPGLCAKPIIDILVGVLDMINADACTAPLQAIGYIYIPFPEFPERRFFLDGPGIGSGPHHLHMTEYGSAFWQDKVLFRNYLRSHPGAVEAYCRLKRDLAAKFGADRDRYEAYTEAKTPFIQGALQEALRAKM